MPKTTSDLNPEIRSELEQQFTSLEEPVYFATSNANSRTVAAAMARLSRSTNDLRYIYGSEFLNDEGKDEEVINRILFEYGDDSVAQLVVMQGVVEGASNLLTKRLEWGRLGSYLEQSTRYLQFDQKDESGRYPFYTPEDFTQEQGNYFDQVTTQIFDAYSIAVRRMEEYLHEIMDKPTELSPGVWKSTLRAQACDAARALLPTSVRSTVGIVGSAQSFENLMTRLKSDELTEAQHTGEKLLHHARLVAPEYFRRVDLPDRGNVSSAYLSDQRERMKEWSSELGLNTDSTETGEHVNLVDVTPRDELEIVKYVLFDASTLSLDAIERILETKSLADKEAILRDYIGTRENRRHKPGRAFEHPHYSWEFITDYGIFRDLQRHRMVDDLRWQQLSTHLGHVEIPELAIQAGVEEEFKKAYELSHILYQNISEQCGPVVAQYCTLLGHMMRWVLTENARQAYHLHELRTSSQGHPGYRRIVNSMHDQITEVHPVIAEGMVHVDRSDNPNLTRLAEALRKAKKARDTGMQ